MKKYSKFNKQSRRPAAWQIDPNNITTEFVQFWHNGVMVTSQMTNAGAKNVVQEGRAFVISSQAIGVLRNGEMES